MNTFKKRRGISTFIATLLLMVLAVAAGVVIYAYTMGYLGSFGTPAQMGAISVDTYGLKTTGEVTSGQVALTVYIRNIGKSSFQLNTVYIGGKLLTSGYNMVYDPTTDTSLKEGKVGTLTINMGTSTDPNYFEPSKTYDIKIIGVDNTQLSFQVKK
jgi:adenine deaminase